MRESYYGLLGSIARVKYYYNDYGSTRAMEWEVVVTRKGQVTIPAECRRKYGIKKGTRVLVEDLGYGILLRPVPRLEEQAGVDRGRYDARELKRLLDEVRAEWR